MTGAGHWNPRDEHRAARAAWRALGPQRRRAVERDARRGQRPGDEHALAVGQELARLRLGPPAGQWQRRAARVFGPWSMVGASAVLAVEAAVFLLVDGVPPSVGAAVVLVAALCGLAGVLRLRADRRAGALLDLGRVPLPPAGAAPATAAPVTAAPVTTTRPAAARSVVRPPSAVVPQPAVVVLPPHRRSREDTATGPMSTV